MNELNNKKRICLDNIIRVYGILFLSFGCLNAIFWGLLIYEPNLVLAFLTGITLSLSFNFFKLYKKKSRVLQEIMSYIKKTIDYIDYLNGDSIDLNYNNERSE